VAEGLAEAEGEATSGAEALGVEELVTGTLARPTAVEPPNIEASCCPSTRLVEAPPVPDVACVSVIN